MEICGKVQTSDKNRRRGNWVYFNKTMPKTNRKRPTHRRLPTPKGEAKAALGQAELCLRDLKAVSKPGREEVFVRQLNEFLAAAHKVSEFLPKENAHGAGFEQWARQEIERLPDSDQRYEYFQNLRSISIHDCIVRPDTAQHTVEIVEQIRISGHAEIELRDAEGRVTSRGIYDGPVGAESIHEVKQVSTKYFFTDRQNEDIVSFCEAVLVILRNLVSQAYHLFP